MTERNPDTRCRLVIIAPAMDDAGALLSSLSDALDGGDVASVILPQYAMDERAFQTLCEKVVPALQQRGVAVMIAGDTRIAGRVGADGIHADDARALIEETAERFDERLMFGAGGAKTRHDALELGETRPDYIFFGRIGYDTKPEAHPRNLSLAEWWSEMVALPCVVLGGSDMASAEAVAATRADFVAFGHAVFDHPEGPRAAVSAINALLDRVAPDLEPA